MNIIKKGEIHYPRLLETINNAPEVLYVNGNEGILNNKAISIIGSRNMTNYGKEIAKKIVKELSLSGMCIVSGLAIGIDSVAHKTCLENGGKTIAVLGSGLNNVFPPENKNLYNEIIKKGGCVISEYPPNEKAQKSFFPKRNRIVSGLSLATLVIEATYRSGTSITAGFAIQQGRKLFCIPNSIGNKNSIGTINWLKKGAILVTNAQEILYELGINNKKANYEYIEEIQKENLIKIKENKELQNLDINAKEIYYYIKENKIVNSELLCNEFNLEIRDINAYLTILELKGLIKNISGFNYKVSDEFYV